MASRLDEIEMVFRRLCQIFLDISIFFSEKEMNEKFALTKCELNLHI